MKPLAVVTGGAKGIGRAISVRLAAEGFDVVAASRAPRPPPEGVRGATLDVTDAAAVAAFFAALPRCDMLVNNAGLAGANALGDLAAWNAIVASNLTGAYLCASAASGRLPDGSGRIVNIGSVLALRGVADQTAYCAAKHGLIGLTRALALALAPRGITVNAVCPSWVATDMARARWRELGIDEQEAGAGLPIGRVTPERDVADAVAFCIRQGTLTGAVLPLDGGATARV